MMRLWHCRRRLTPFHINDKFCHQGKIAGFSMGSTILYSHQIIDEEVMHRHYFNFPPASAARRRPASFKLSILVSPFRLKATLRSRSRFGPVGDGVFRIAAFQPSAFLLSGFCHDGFT